MSYLDYFSTGINYLPPTNTAPSSPKFGDAYFDTNSCKLMFYNGNIWISLAPPPIGIGSGLVSVFVPGELEISMQSISLDCDCGHKKHGFIGGHTDWCSLNSRKTTQ